MPAEGITKRELLERLAEGSRAGITVVTPNARLARELAREFDAGQAARGLAAWETADVLPFDAFVERCYEDALTSQEGSRLPVLLSPAEERELWAQAIERSRWAGALLDAPRTAARAMQAWRLAHAWRIAGALGKSPGSEDARAFAAWARAYRARLRRDGLVDAATLPDLAPRSARTRLLVAYAFDVLPPQTADVLARYPLRACRPAPRSARPRRAGFASAKEELECAARWARARLEAGAARIGVVVPDLVGRRREVARVFSGVMRPGYNAPPARGEGAGGTGARTEMPFNISAGEPLAAHPLAAFALSFLELAAGEVAFEAASRLLRSPFLAAAEAELAARARLDARLRREAPAAVSLSWLIARSDPCPRLRAGLERARAILPRGGAPRDWARHFASVLEAAGFPGERALDSAEYQTRAKWNEALGELARLGSVLARMDGGEALGRLRRICAETPFQPEAPDAPVQVLGLLESAGLEFDALWVSGLTDEAWPLHPRPDPFLPPALQKRAGIPQAAAETSLALDRRITAGWAAAADEVVFSWPRREEDRDLAPSPLVAPYEEAGVAIPAYASWRERIFASRALEEREDAQAGAVAAKAVHGGTRVLADQAACPFRAFARHRLRAEALESPAPGPDAAARGRLLHALLAAIWRELKSSAALAADAGPVIARAAREAVREIGLEGRLAEIEVARLARIARQWLELERGRGAFEVVRIEEKAPMEIGGIALSGRIDRMDRLGDGTHAVIDYKTGSRVTSADWLGERPDEPQLPLYVLTAREEVAAVAFAKVRAGDMRFAGFSRAGVAIPGLERRRDWERLVAAWRAELERLARAFAAGHAPVDPKRGLQTCRACDLQTLCRVHEKLDALAGADAEGA